MSNVNTQSGYQYEGANEDDSTQTSPGWMLTFVPFANPELSNPIPPEYNTTPEIPSQQSPNGAYAKKAPKWSSQRSSNAINTAPILTVTSDCLSVTTADTKENPHGTMSAMLLPGAVNYLATIALGDYVFVNMVEYEGDLDELQGRALNGTPINLLEDGFKGVFRVTSVRMELMSDTSSGTRFMAYRIEGKSFSELENSMYFNPYIAQSFAAGGDVLYATNVLGTAWQNKIGTATDLQTIVQTLINLILGNGPKLRSVSSTPVASPTNGTEIQPKSSILTTPNVYFQVAGAVASLLGVADAGNFMSLYRYFFGVQNYTIATKPIGKHNNARQAIHVGDTSKNFNAQAYNPQYTPDSNNFYWTPQPVQGMTTIRPEYFNQSTGWSIINSYCNAPVNEMYTCFRLSPEGYVMPFLIFRQIPFSTNFYASTNATATAFLSLPRWVISPDIVRGLSIGRDDALRLNFVQVFGQPFGFNSAGTEASIAVQNASNTNYVAETDDVKRSGLRPYVFNNSMDFAANKQFQSQTWAKLLGDALIGGHMKLSGSISCFGIQDPITIGDNLQFDGIVYHIEGITHECAIGGDGKKNFTTNITLSHGVDANSTATYTVYGETINKLYPAEAVAEWNKEQIMPGVVNDQFNSQPPSPASVLPASILTDFGSIV